MTGTEPTAILSLGPWSIERLAMARPKPSDQNRKTIIKDMKPASPSHFIDPSAETKNKVPAAAETIRSLEKKWVSPRQK